MLHALDDHGARAPLNVQDPLDAEHVLAAEGELQIEPGIEQSVFQRLIEDQAECADAVIVAVEIVHVGMALAMSVAVILSMFFVVVLRAVLIPVGL